jgi:hypothetical protein
MRISSFWTRFLGFMAQKDHETQYFKTFFPFSKKLPPYTLAGFDLTTHRSSLLAERRRRYHKTTPPGQYCKTLFDRFLFLSATFGRNCFIKSAPGPRAQAHQLGGRERRDEAAQRAAQPLQRSRLIWPSPGVNVMKAILGDFLTFFSAKICLKQYHWPRLGPMLRY